MPVPASFATRYDLVPMPKAGLSNWTSRAFGAVDGKAVDARSFSERVTQVINGPTADEQPPFQWSAYCPMPECNISHVGVVDHFNFGWMRYRPSLPWKSEVSN